MQPISGISARGERTLATLKQHAASDHTTHSRTWPGSRWPSHQGLHLTQKPPAAGQCAYSARSNLPRAASGERRAWPWLYNHSILASKPARGRVCSLHWQTKIQTRVLYMLFNLVPVCVSGWVEPGVGSGTLSRAPHWSTGTSTGRSRMPSIEHHSSTRVI